MAATANYTQKVKEALKSLGTTENKICATLEKKNLLGVTGEVDNCPVARYLGKVFKNATNISVDTDRIQLDFPKESVVVKPSKVVASFIQNFDNDHHKHLDEKNNPE